MDINFLFYHFKWSFIVFIISCWFNALSWSYSMLISWIHYASWISACGSRFSLNISNFDHHLTLEVLCKISWVSWVWYLRFHIQTHGRKKFVQKQRKGGTVSRNQKGHNGFWKDLNNGWHLESRFLVLGQKYSTIVETNLEGFERLFLN